MEMGKKRKSIATRLEEVDQTMYATFCSAANSLSHLYTQSMNHHKLSLLAGERHGLEKLYQWILRQQEAGTRMTTVDIVNYLQNELDYCGDEPSVSPRAPMQVHQSQGPMHFTNTGFHVSGPSAQTTAANGPRSDPYDNPTKNPILSNALSSPVRWSLHNYHLAQGGDYPCGNGARTNETNHQNRDLNSNDSSMDMHQDSSGQE